jgi:hypothetical protein
MQHKVIKSITKELSLDEKKLNAESQYELAIQRLFEFESVISFNEHFHELVKNNVIPLLEAAAQKSHVLAERLLAMLYIISIDQSISLEMQPEEVFSKYAGLILKIIKLLDKPSHQIDYLSQYLLLTCVALTGDIHRSFNMLQSLSKLPGAAALDLALLIVCAKEINYDSSKIEDALKHRKSLISYFTFLLLSNSKVLSKLRSNALDDEILFQKLLFNTFSASPASRDLFFSFSNPTVGHIDHFLNGINHLIANYTSCHSKLPPTLKSQLNTKGILTKLDIRCLPQYSKSLNQVQEAEQISFVGDVRFYGDGHEFDSNGFGIKYQKDPLEPTCVQFHREPANQQTVCVESKRASLSC